VHFVGIDLAWSPRNPSGGAVLSASGRVLASTSALGGDNEVLNFVTEALPRNSPGLVAIDAPLSVPNETGARPCDRQVASVFGRYHAAPYPANRQNLSRYGGLRAEAIRRRLQALGFRIDPAIRRQDDARRVIEVFPHPATVSLFQLSRTLKYKARSTRTYELRWHELGQLRDHLVSLRESTPPLRLPPELANIPLEGLRGRRMKGVEDLLDAIVCAYSVLYAWHHGRRGYAIYGRPTQGCILVPMTPSMWQRIKAGRLLLLDRDGTLNQGLESGPPNHPAEIRLLPGVAAKLHLHASMGWRIVIITNQGGVAFGYLTEAQAYATQQALLDALPVEVDASYLCPHHPKGTIPRYSIACPNRKPAPGAILDALKRFGARPQDCLFVGDRDTDQQAARAAGVPFAWAWNFFESGSKACEKPSCQYSSTEPIHKRP
jgi:histidinol-phosphate phosphatase family protein